MASDQSHSPMNAKNVMGGTLLSCSQDPVTGFFRNGCCDTGPEDLGSHTVCVILTDEFLQFSKSRGNDLTTPMPQYQFPGLRAGDQWCLCAARWQEALEADCAPSVVLAATHERALDIVDYQDLVTHAVEARPVTPESPTSL